MNGKKLLLVGDNPFHGISHLSQERAMSRANDIADTGYAAGLVRTALNNGADGFMFTVSETTLSIIRTLSREEGHDRLQLYAIVPYAFEFTRLAVRAGGVPGLAMKIAQQIATSLNWKAVINGLSGVISNKPSSLLKSYLLYENYRLKASAGKKGVIASMLLHEVVTDMALALGMEWLIKTHLEFMRELRIKPGFETRNFVYLVKKFREWGIDCRQVVIAAPFNAAGFQMCPTKAECEETLKSIPETEMIAFSVLAAGYLNLPEAIEYVANLPNLSGLALGVSKEHHARETFSFITERL